MAKLTPRQQAFAEAYLGEAELNATEAYKFAGYKAANDNVAAVEGARLLRNPKVAAYIAERRKELASRTDITPEKVLALWWARANVDVNEIVEYRRDCCRYCWGVNHRYQWTTEAEYEQAKAESENELDTSGGFGFIATRAPHPECPECQGEGKGKVHVHDTRRLKGAARQMYRGVHQGKDGLKALVGDPDRALEQVGKILGVYTSGDEKTRLRQQIRQGDELHTLDVAARKLAIEKLKAELSDGDGDKPTPVQIVVEVKDARKRGEDA
ncbi:terminase small subunit [Chromobacterium piscinae]|uniref:terminase small subunit n=1 Tax=Chromobacterium piscinae TaxID=686831 RepID=UPI00320B6AF9